MMPARPRVRLKNWASAILFEEETLTTASRYFLATITAKQRDAVIELSCMIRRQSGRTEIVWQRYL